ncbi:glycosyl hydrolase [Luteolibacter arcticus]|uniref:Glycosyl hydrolase n=1 Tax=Luteolibacter arcticus TaxID=1581411 RepID=A0ABT3GQD9_9BACT|nr:LamG-like jellyroll fold domain-containing protein [Luteolibacter arcticus]MCW1925725.1 glycosyl hydrolase [Luteolibacter arcticus]
MIAELPFRCRGAALRVLVLLSLTSLVCVGQTLNLANNVHRTSALVSGTTVTLTGKSELHVSGAEDPLPGCTIHLNSSDSWLFMSAFRPSQVAATFLGRVRVNGAVAAINQNARVVQFENGTVVIPHGPNFTPMEVFDGKSYAGNSKKLNLYTYYNDANLGTLKTAVSSFRLKRGYMATVAQQENGLGASKVYIAQDADIELGTLPGNLDNQIRYVRIFPWRWVGKKGWAGSSHSGRNVNHMWHYDWGAEADSNGLDSEYVPMRHGPWWPGFDVINAKRNVTHLLGYNEPDNTWDPAQTPQTVDQALAQWPELMKSGLRLGSPVVTEGGLAWLYEFMDRATALGYRVDFVPVHFYSANKTDWDLHVLLRDIHQRTGRPVWLTEFNNGASWTCCKPTMEENATKIGQFIDMMNGWSSFVERYSVYSWDYGPEPEPYNRRIVWDDGSTLPAGVRYRNTLSPLSQGHEVPDTGAGGAAHYVFEGDLRDSSGNGNEGTVIGAASFDTGKSGQALVLDGSDSYLRLPPRLGDSTDFTFAAWVRWSGDSGNWQRVFDFGTGTDKYLFLSPNGTGSSVRFAIKNGGAEQQLNHPIALTPNVWTHVAVTIGGTTGKLFINGVPVATNTAMDINPGDLGTTLNYLGKSQHAADALFSGRIDDLRFLTTALTEAQIAAIHSSTQPQFTADPLVKTDAAPGQPYTGSLDANVTGGPVTFSKFSGPAWLAVAADGSLTGVPGLADTGMNSFLVRATTGAGTIDTSVLQIRVKEAPGLVARYGFQSNTQATAGTAHGTATGGPAYVTGKRGPGIDLDGTDDFVSLPAGVASHDEITVATWVNWDGGGNWQRIFDFGNGQESHLFLSPKSGGNRMVFLIRHGGVEQSTDTATLGSGWIHVAATIGGGFARLYVNGLQVSSVATALKPSDIQPVSNFIGKSQFADPLFNGRVDEFHVFNRALSTTEITAAMNGQAPVFTTDPLSQPAAAVGQPYEQFLTGVATDPDAGSTLIYSKVAGPRWLSVAANGRISGVPSAADAGMNRLVLRVTDPTGLADDAAVNINVPGPADLLAHYQFHNATTDQTGGTAGINNGVAVYDHGVLDRAIRLDGTDDHLRLRNNIVSGVNDVTVAARVRWNGGSNWQRIFDFGNNTSQYMLMTPKSGGNTLRFTISINGNAVGAEKILETTPLVTGEWTHVAVTLNGDTGTLYVNGAAVDSETTITVDPSAFNPTLNYLGKSQFADPYFNGLIDDFRVFNRALSAAEVKDLAVPAAAVAVPDSSFEGWAAGISFPVGQGDPVDDPDADGVANLLEYLFSSDPLRSSAGDLPQGQRIPGTQLEGAPDPAKTYLRIQVRVRKSRPFITITPESSATLAGLSAPGAANNAIQAGLPVSDGEHEIFTWFHEVPVEDAETGFMRLRVIKN